MPAAVAVSSPDPVGEGRLFLGCLKIYSVGALTQRLIQNESERKAPAILHNTKVTLNVF